MKSEEITYVIQGPVCNTTSSLIDGILGINDRANIIVSTWASSLQAELINKYSNTANVKIITNDDPGQVSGGKETWFNNINRMITSTLNGVRAVRTPYAMKVRADATLDYSAFYSNANPNNNNSETIIAEIFANEFIKKSQCIRPKLFLTKPIIMCWSMSHAPFFTYYMSDWFQFGLTKDLVDLWDIPLACTEDAEYFKHHHQRSSIFCRYGQYISNDFLARWHSEQYVLINFLIKKGHVPLVNHRNDWSLQKLLAGYKVLVSDFGVVDRSSICFKINKYPQKKRFFNLWLFKFLERSNSDFVSLVVLATVYTAYAFYLSSKKLIVRIS